MTFRNWYFTRSRILNGACLIIGLLAAAALVPLNAARAEFETDFKIAENYFRLLADKNSILVKIPVRLTHRIKRVYGLASDCEMHLAGKPTGMSLGDPRSIVVEPPNLCRFEALGGGR